jgi:stress-induced morphogen
MKIGMLTEDRLREILAEGFGIEAVARVYRDRGKLEAIVVSPSFEGVYEGERQRRVWQLLIDRLSDAEHAQIGFVFTDAPSECVETVGA